MNNKILILVPSFSSKGGIVSYFKALEGKFKLPVSYFTRGARYWPERGGRLWPAKGSKINEFKRAAHDFLKYYRTICSQEYKIVQTNTSLGKLSVIRDGIFLFLAQKCDIRTITFFRGWDEDMERQLKGIKLKLFQKVFLQSDIIIVLSNRIKNKLRLWGYQGKIFVDTTVVDDILISGYEYKDLLEKISTHEYVRYNFLFLTRIERKKGIYETIDAFQIINEQYPNTSLTIVGDGFELQNSKEYVNELGISNVFFKGFLTGIDKADALKKSDIYIFPSYSEGMPNSVLEAMTFGLPVITTPVGGLTDFFEDGRHGYIIRNNNGAQIAELCIKLMLDYRKYSNIAQFNYDYSRKRFASSIVIQRLEEIYKTLIY